MTTAIIDLELGNIGSVFNMLKHIGQSAEIVSDPKALVEAKHIILPGVGSFDACIKRIDAGGWRTALSEVVLQGKKPLLGVCLGMQVLCHGSEEGDASGLHFIDGVCKKFDRVTHPDIRIPHMGWNEVEQGEHPMWNGIADRTRFYFVHSYRYADATAECAVGTCEYGAPFAAALSKPNVFAVQFHPEKSHDAGIHLYRNFLTWDGAC